MNTKGNLSNKNFVNDYRVYDINAYRGKKPAMTRAERNKAVSDIAKSMERVKIGKRENHRKRKIKQAQAVKRKFIGRMAVFGLASIALFAGGNKIYNEYNQHQQQNSPAQLNEVLETGTTLDELGINGELMTRMEYVQNTLLRDDLSNEELIRLSKTISDLQFDVTKTKLGNLLGISQDNIKLYTRNEPEGKTRETVEVMNKYGNREDIYTNKSFFENKNTFSPEVSNMIKDIAGMQDVIQKVQEGNFNREEFLEIYKDKLKTLKQFAGMKLKIDEKGNISADVIKNKDLNQYEEAIEVAANKYMDTGDEPEL